MTIREKINYLEAIEETINHVKSQMEWNMELVYNEETGECIVDAEGKYVHKVPEFGTSAYYRYEGYKTLLSHIEKLAEKC